MFASIVRFELAYQLRRPSTYLYGVLLFAFGFWMISANEWNAPSRMKANAPFTIAEILVNMTMIAQVVTAAFVGLSVLRDFDLGAHELFFSTPITKRSYLGGRFVGAVLVLALMFALLPLGMAIGSVMPWVEGAKYQPFVLWHYVSPYLVLVLPTVLAIGALFFAVGVTTRSQLAVYVTGFALLMADVVVDTFRTDTAKDAVKVFTDPFGSASFYLVTRYWTITEKNELTVPLAGAMLQNRVFVLALAAAFVAIAFAVFRFDTFPRSLRRARARMIADDAGSASIPSLKVPTHRRTYSWVRDAYASTTFSFAWIARSIPFLSIATIAMIGLGLNAWDMTKGSAPRHPLTYLMAENVTGMMSLFTLLLVTLYAGELVWHDRQVKAAELADSLPTSSSATMLGRVVGLLGVVAALYAVTVATSVAAQAVSGHRPLEVPVYLQFVYLTEFPRVASLVLMAFFLHTVVNNKYVGHLVMIASIIAVVTFDGYGWEHRLYQPGATPAFVYSDMNGFGPYVPKLAWYAAYWLSFGTMLLVVANLFVVRGSEIPARARLALARTRLTRKGLVAGVAALSATAGCAATIFYQTNVVQEYTTRDAQLDQQALYERTFRSYRELPQPTLAHATLRLDVEPERLSQALRGQLTYINVSGRPIDTLFLSSRRVRPGHPAPVDSLRFDRAVEELSGSNRKLGVRLYRLRQPLKAGETLLVSFATRDTARGFSNGRGNISVARNGTFTSANSGISFGYNRDAEISDVDERKKRKLDGKPGALPPLADSATVRDDHVPETFHLIVSTAPDQIAVAPGTRTREWTEDGRRFFEFRGDSVTALSVPVMSARYAERKDWWVNPAGGDSVAISIFYHPAHAYNVDRMVRSVQRSLDYFTKAWGPYQFSQFRVLEYPRYEDLALAYAATIPYSEAAGFISQVRKGNDAVDGPFSITAHEMAHQWWGLQVRRAPLEGSRMLNETLAQYGELVVFEREYGELPTRTRRGQMMDNYLNGRSREARAEHPIARNQGQGYLVYAKGGVAMYALADYIGKDRVDSALRGYIADNKSSTRRSNTARLLDRFRAVTPDSLKHVIGDLFETITVFENRADSAAYTRRGDGKFVVRAWFNARKLRADSVGVETAIPMNDLVDVAVLGPPSPDDPLGKRLYFAKHRITSGANRFEFVVDQQPAKAGIDPYRKLIDRISTDNVTEVRVR